MLEEGEWGTRCSVAVHQDIHSVKNVGEHSWKSEYHLHQWGVGKNAVLHTEDMSKLKRIKVCCEKHWPGFRTVNNRAVKNSHISPLWSHSWLRVSQRLCCTNARRACRKRCSRAEQTNYTPVKAVALHCIIPTEAPQLHCEALLWLRSPGTAEPWGLACVARS